MTLWLALGAPEITKQHRRFKQVPNRCARSPQSLLHIPSRFHAFSMSFLGRLASDLFLLDRLESFKFLSSESRGRD